jgi:cytochrome c551/c552
MQQAATPPAQVVTVLLASVILIPLSGCGASTAPSTQASLTSTEPQYVSEPFTPQQQLVEQGARLVVSSGCAACHLAQTKQNVGPSFANFAGHPVTLADGRRALVDEHFLREALLHPGKDPIKGYDPAPMLAVTRHLHLSSQPEQVAALAAFIEEIGPEPG